MTICALELSGAATAVWRMLLCGFGTRLPPSLIIKLYYLSLAVLWMLNSLLLRCPPSLSAWAYAEDGELGKYGYARAACDRVCVSAKHDEHLVVAGGDMSKHAGARAQGGHGAVGPTVGGKIAHQEAFVVVEEAGRSVGQELAIAVARAANHVAPLKRGHPGGHAAGRLPQRAVLVRTDAAYL